ncbi:glycosyltransferase [Treponema primitia]|uniref:glycosyltransferase n=1 Tax=Treponema primitia TaxID=88058 RepID=UPI000255556C|nr:glycosyltransferase [Treponema primitia]
MTKILIVGIHNAVGGIEKILHDYITTISNDAIVFAFINMYDKISFQEAYEQRGYPVYKLPNMNRHPLKYAVAFTRLCADERFDIIHVNMMSAANILPLVIARQIQCKVIIAHSHNTDTVGIARHILHAVNRPFIKAFATDYFACSADAGQYIFGKNSAFEIIHNAINIERFVYRKITRKTVRDQLNIPDNAYVIGHVGRFSKQKNHAVLIEIFCRILNKQENAVLLLVGKGEDQQKIKNMAKNLGIDTNVIFYGPSNTVHDLYSAMDVFVFPSLFEGLPVVGIEAQCAGLPVFASNTVSKQMQVSDLVVWLDLKDGPEKWADTILEHIPHHERKDMSSTLTNAGYNIKIESKKLESKYLELAKR